MESLDGRNEILSAFHITCQHVFLVTRHNLGYIQLKLCYALE